MFLKMFYLSFESFLEGEDGGVDCVFEFHVVVESFLQKRFPVHVVLAHRGRLPREVSAGRIALCVKKEKKITSNDLEKRSFIYQ